MLHQHPLCGGDLSNWINAYNFSQYTAFSRLEDRGVKALFSSTKPLPRISTQKTGGTPYLEGRPEATAAQKPRPQPQDVKKKVGNWHNGANGPKSRPTVRGRPPKARNACCRPIGTRLLFDLKTPRGDPLRGVVGQRLKYGFLQKHQNFLGNALRRGGWAQSAVFSCFFCVS